MKRSTGIALAIAGWLLAVAAIAVAVTLAGALRNTFADARREAAIERPPGPSALPADPAALDPGERRILVLGDSRVRRWEPAPEIAGARVLLRGVGGETTRALRARAAAEIAAARPAVVVVAAGINDVVAAGLSPRLEAVLVDAAVANVAAIARDARAAGAAAVVLTMPRPAAPDPVRRLLVWSDRIPPLAARANAGLRALASEPGVRVVDADAALAGDSPLLPARYAVDALHFSPAAYAALNDLLRSELE
ncbi:MAG: GDSL-type esterase/lipase family protein [Myxococcota bacterium]